MQTNLSQHLRAYTRFIHIVCLPEHIPLTVQSVAYNAYLHNTYTQTIIKCRKIIIIIILMQNI